MQGSTAKGLGSDRPPLAPSLSASGMSAVSLLVVVLLFGVGGYGAYYGYNRYRLGEAISGFDQEAADDLHNWLMRKNHPIGAADLRQFASELAGKHGLTVEPGDLKAVVEPYTPSSAAKLSTVMRSGLEMARKTTRGGGPDLWVVGFRAELQGRVGAASGRFVSEHYTWFEQVKP